MKFIKPGLRKNDARLYFRGLRNLNTKTFGLTSERFRMVFERRILTKITNDCSKKFGAGIVGITFLCLFTIFAPGSALVASAHDSPKNSFSWDIQRIDAPKLLSEVTDRSLRLDANGRPHIAYGGDYLYYAWYDGAGWRLETVDTSEGVGSYASLALDVNGNPHISYYDTTNHDLKYARRTQNGWEIQIVDGAYVAYSSTSIEIGQDGRPYIGYVIRNNGTRYALKIAHWNGSTWNILTVDDSESSKGYVSLALDRNDNPHVSYQGSSTVRYARWTGISWEIQDAVQGYGFGEHTSIALDKNDRPHITYSYLYGGLYYTRWTGSSWYSEVVDTSGDRSGWFNSLALDSHGSPHISYYNQTHQSLNYARLTENGWILQPIESRPDISSLSGYTFIFTSITLDGLDNPHISYFGFHDGIVRHAYCSQNTWYIEMIDKAGKAGLYPSLALDANSYPHISYLDTSYGELKFARWTGSAWDIQVVDNSSFTGYFTSLALDSHGYPHISYYDLIYGSLRYARWMGSGWEIHTVDSPADGSLYTVGWYTSLALDMYDNPHISYFDENGTSVKYAHWTGTSWDIQIIEQTSALFTKNTSIAIDSQNHPHIIYQYASGGKYARWTGSNWDIQTVEDWGIWNSSLALDASDNAHISYRKYYYNGAVGLTYAHWTGSSWDIQEVDCGAEWGDGLGYFSSIFLDSKGNPHISYYDKDNKKLKYARYTGLAWDIQIVDNGVDVGIYTSIAVDRNDNPHIAYYDNYLGDLKYAKGTLVGPDISVAPTRINFNNVSVGNNLDQTITIRNDGAANLIVGTIGLPSFPFAIFGATCTDGMTLAPAMSCSLVVRFAPDTPGPFSSSFSITSNDPDESSVNINLNGTGVAVLPYTITSIPEKLQLKVDGSIYTSPVVMNWLTGSTHTIEVTSPQAESGGSRLTFTSWSDGGAQSHSITTPFSSTNYTANFVIQYTLTTSVDPPGIGTTVVPSGTTWQDKDKIIYLWTSNNNIYYDFSHWSGDLSGSANPMYFTIDRPMNVTAIYISKSENISVDSPNGGEAWAAGSTQTIRWYYIGNPGSYVKIELLKGGVVKSTINSSAPIGSEGTGSYNWSIPFTQTPGSDYQIKISSTSNSNRSDTSDNNFTIVGTISLVSPNGGETLTAGSTQTIQWTYGGDPGSRVKIELLKGSMVNRTIASRVPMGSGGTGSFNWKIPSNQPYGTEYQIRVTSMRNGSYTETSDSNFTILGPPPPPVNVSASDGMYVDKVKVTWTASLAATSYTVYRATSLSRLARKITLGTASETFFNDTTATPGTTYYYWVKASNTYGTSDFSSYDAGYR